MVLVLSACLAVPFPNADSGPVNIVLFHSDSVSEKKVIAAGHEAFATFNSKTVSSNRVTNFMKHSFNVHQIDSSYVSILVSTVYDGEDAVRWWTNNSKGEFIQKIVH